MISAQTSMGRPKLALVVFLTFGPAFCLPLWIFVRSFQIGCGEDTRGVEVPAYFLQVPRRLDTLLALER